MKIIHVGKSINDFKINSLLLVSQITWTVGIVLVVVMYDGFSRRPAA